MFVQEDSDRGIPGWIVFVIAGLVIGVIVFIMVTNRGNAERTQFLASLRGDSFGEVPEPEEDLGPVPRSAALTEQAVTMLEQPGQVVKAEGLFRRAVEDDPKNTAAWSGLGWCRLKIAQRFIEGPGATAMLNRANEAFLTCVEIDPRHESALSGLGHVALLRRCFDEAEEHLLQSTGAATTWPALAKLYLLQERFDEAQPWCRQVVQTSPDDAYAKAMLTAAEMHKLAEPLRRYLQIGLAIAR